MQMNPNMMRIMQLMKSEGNPQQMVMNLLGQQAQDNPMLANLLSLAKEGKTGNIEEIARNMLKSQGLDFDKEFSSFKQMLGFK